MSERGDIVARSPKVAERIFSNKIFLRELRLRPKNRQSDSEIFHRLLDDLDDQPWSSNIFATCRLAARAGQEGCYETGRSVDSPSVRMRF